MSLENRLRETLQDKGEKVLPKPELKTKVMIEISRAHEKGSRRMKKRLLVSVLIALLIIPTSAFAYQTFLADELYGSFENVKKHITTVTMESFLLINAKLSQAKGDLGKEKYDQFKDILSVITNAKLEYSNKYGNIDYDQVPPEEMLKIKKAKMEIQPYFDKLNGQPSSQEILTPEEYELYIESLITYEKIKAQSEIDTNKSMITVELMPEELQEEFLKARDFMDYVNQKQQQSVNINQ
ncbi:DUF3600 domain-containing protein [Chengkuizengella marina]|uniref:DUF3600 domain-containing protein n=1 Tax=Chengkuizengella marina TaxID=2507566 RepID=A0A6N9Q370_9BACL|nr:DUF3600 domain-containing protein [Chengkuizengella marina]NBI29230.1 DUF3600 domain-containing protein [Chengkuizengella marina]